MISRWRWTVRLLALLGTPVLAGAAGWLLVVATGGLLTDVDAFAIWSFVPGAVLATFAPTMLIRLARTPRSAVRSLVLSVLWGAAVGLATTVLLALAVGPVLLLFGVPVAPLWIGACGIVLAVAHRIARPVPSALVESRADWDRIIVRVLAVVSTIVAVPIGLVFVTVLVNRGEDELHLLPDGFTGAVVIVFGDSAGMPAVYEDETRVYRIPPSGVLRSQFRANFGRYSRRYAWVRTDGTRTPVPLWRPKTEAESTSTTSDSLDGTLEVNSLGTTYKYAGTEQSGGTKRVPAPAYRAYVLAAAREQRSFVSRGNMLVDSVVFGTQHGQQE